MKDLFDGAAPPALPQLVAGYLDYMKGERTASPHTLVNYEADLRHWLKFLFDRNPGRFDLAQLTDLKSLREFLGSATKKYERTTVARRLSVIKGFLKFLHREGYLDRNVAKLIRLPRTQEKLPHVLKPEEAAQMLDQMPSGNLREKRLRACAELLYSTGIRVSELTGLDHDRVDFRAGSLLVAGKGRKERVVPMGRHCQLALRTYIDAMPPSQKPAPGESGTGRPVFLNRDGGRVSVRTIQRDLKNYALEALGSRGVNVSPHTMRHSCATHLLAGGAGLREIQELLGHRSLVTTQKYTQVDVERLKRAYDKAHPKERERRKKDEEL